MKVIAPTQRQMQPQPATQPQTHTQAQMPSRMRTYGPADAHIPAYKVLRALNIELLGLVAASMVVLFGLALVYTAKEARLDESGVPSAVIPLYDLTSAAQLEPVLTMFPSPVERQMVAQALYRRATSPPALDRVGALADLHLLSRADIVAIKPRLAVRSLAQFNRSLAVSVA